MRLPDNPSWFDVACALVTLAGVVLLCAINAVHAADYHAQRDDARARVARFERACVVNRQDGSATCRPGTFQVKVSPR